MKKRKSIYHWNESSSMKLTIFLLFISSSMGFFFGMTRLVRARCNASNILLIMCSTSSDDLVLKKLKVFSIELKYKLGEKKWLKKYSHLNWYVLSTSSIWWMACCKWLAASWICCSFHGDSGLMAVRWDTFCARWTLKLISYDHIWNIITNFQY